MEKKIKIGLLGVGCIAHARHIPDYKEIDDCVIWALCDIDEETLQKTASELNIPKERCYTDYKELIAKAGVDAVDICTPNYVHYEMALHAIKNKIPFSCEKPMCINYAQALDVFKKAKVANVPGFICYSWRYRPNVLFMKELYQSGIIGDLHQVYASTIKNSAFIPGRKLEWRFEKEKCGAGVLYDLNSHTVDITRFLTNDEFDYVMADSGIAIKEREKLDGSGMGEVTTDDWCDIIAKTKNKVSINYRISRATTGVSSLMDFELFGSKGSLRFSAKGWFVKDQTVELRINKEACKILETPERFLISTQGKAFLNVVRGNTEGIPATIEDALMNQKVLSAELKATVVGTKVYIDDITEKENY